MARLRIPNQRKQLLIELYKRTRKTVDDLPYTEEFERLYESFIQRSGLNMNRHDVWRALASQRKASRLVRKER
ncbi:MAG: hypothetical protein KKB50_15675 [Planctomycetes bacterium]|nr:hypothetical protein [Planctomycetota bacterium]